MRGSTEVQEVAQESWDRAERAQTAVQERRSEGAGRPAPARLRPNLSVQPPNLANLSPGA